MSYVTGEVPFLCRICQAGYVFSNGLKKDFEYHYVGETIHYCEACDLGTNSWRELKAHECDSLHHQKMKFFRMKPASQSSSEANYKCKNCEYRNTCLACLKWHMSIKNVNGLIDSCKDWTTTCMYIYDDRIFLQAISTSGNCPWFKICSTAHFGYFNLMFLAHVRWLLGWIQ